MKRLGLLILSMTVIYAVGLDALNHNPDNIFYANPWMGEIRLRANKGAVSEAFVLYTGKRTKMNLIFQDDTYDYFTADVGRFDTTFNYQILVRDKNDSLILPTVGAFKSSQPYFSVPEWALGKIYYSILIDGFYNGKKENDPKNVVAWGKAPDKEYSYGGDIAGIIEKLPYLDTLNFDILLLLPIFQANSNHKYNPRDYTALDPNLGDTIELKTLINEVHKLKKRIIFKFIATHTGSDFQPFLDVIKNGSSSKYFNWYLVKSLPVKLSPPNYECWLNDPRFPKLNLKEPSVQAFLIGYIDYWLRFGFDGVYIGEDSKIEPDFIRMLRNTLKKKYPDILILGSSDILGANGFDGTMNKKITDLIINYFVKNAISTSEFDYELRKALFFYPSQANLVNTIGLSELGKRIAAMTDISNLLLIYAFLFTFCGSPMLTYGDEIGIAVGHPLNMGSFPWNFSNQERTLFEEIKRLINIRKTNPIFSTKYFFPLYVNDINRVYAYDRGGIIVILNGGVTPNFVTLPVWNGKYTNLITGEKNIVANQQLKVSVPAKSFKIIKHEI
jgi:glycosidase